MKKTILFVFLFATVASFTPEQQKIVVDVDHPRSEIQPTMWGLFFEDINFGADGGLYAELIKNRSFEFYKPKTGWKITVNDRDSSRFLIMNRGADATNMRFARLTLESSGKFCMTNSGFRGIGLKQNNLYHFSIMASVPGNGKISLIVEAVNSKGEVMGTTRLEVSGNEWKKYSADLTPSQTDLTASLNIWFEGEGLVDIDMISLFPNDTWKNRPNGLRADLVQLLADMKPGFLRFPGGCIVEGYDLSLRYQWKKTIGQPENRDLIINRWNSEFAHRPAPDYFQSFGLGFYEYFLLAEDIGAAPLPILNCGMACQFNTAELASLDQMDPYIQDALDLIEFANGPVDSEWGSIRAKMGHPETFNLKYLGIGNEQWGPQYIERYQLFKTALKSKYPEIVLISGTGPYPDGNLFDFAAEALKDLDAEIVDEHYYRPPAWFRENAGRYDNYSRADYKIFAGEYAAQSVHTGSPDNKNNWECALAEAAFMTGLERNADLVVMCSYAPLFAHVDGWQWTPDLIWFNNLDAFGTANYYVQKLFSLHKGTHVLNMLQNGEPLTGNQGVYASAVWDDKNNEIIIKIVNTGSMVQKPEIVLQSGRRILPEAFVTVLRHDEADAINSIDQPKKVFPDERKILMKGRILKPELDPNSLTVFRIKVK